MDLGNRKILVISQDQDDRQQVLTNLKNWRTDVHGASTLLRASAILLHSIESGEPFEIVVVDESEVVNPAYVANLINGEITLDPVKMVLIADRPSRKREQELSKLGYQSIIHRPVDKVVLFNMLHGLQSTGTVVDSRVLRLHQFRGDQKPPSYSILLAEDNPSNQKVIQTIAQRGGHKIHIVGDCKEALHAIEEHSFDVAIIDIQKPESGGVDAIKIYRAASIADDEQLPFIVLTSNTNREAARECEELNVDAFLSKPVRSAELLDAIDQVVNKYRPEQKTTTSPNIISLEQNIYRDPNTGRYIFDRQVLLDLEQLESDPAFLGNLMNGFIRDSEALLEAMQVAVQNKNTADYRENAHALAGNAAGVGALLLQDACAAGSGLDDINFYRTREQLFESTKSAFLLTKRSVNAYLAQARRSSH